MNQPIVKSLSYSDSLDFIQYLFSVLESQPGYHITLGIPYDPHDYGNFFDFPCFWCFLKFWGLLARYFGGCPLLELDWCVSHDNLGVASYWKEDRSYSVPFPSHPIKSTYHQHDLLPFILTLVIWMRQCLSAFPIGKLAFSLLLYALWKEVIMCNPHFKRGELFTPRLTT